MKRIWVFLSLLCAFNSANATAPGEIIFGKWKIVEILDASSLAAFTTKEQAKQIIGEVLTINKNEVRFQGVVGLSPLFTKSKQNISDCFYDGYCLDPVKLHLPKTFTVVNIEYEPNGSYTFYLQNKNNIIFRKRGYFYQMTREK
ncbi:hypothetical protein [Paraherbaspirillum soli]|uniref:DUF2147 domain-containing protein n=1 Tax=Paraherbaspirillum soli TaxID=631222 RepID=A0ABW0M9C5_9BURK